MRIFKQRDYCHAREKVIDNAGQYSPLWDGYVSCAAGVLEAIRF